MRQAELRDVCAVRVVCVVAPSSSPGTHACITAYAGVPARTTHALDCNESST